jgi:hypothetical protein
MYIQMTTVNAEAYAQFTRSNVDILEHENVIQGPKRSNVDVSDHTAVLDNPSQHKILSNSDRLVGNDNTRMSNDYPPITKKKKQTSSTTTTDENVVDIDALLDAFASESKVSEAPVSAPTPASATTSSSASPYSKMLDDL